MSPAPEPPCSLVSLRLPVVPARGRSGTVSSVLRAKVVSVMLVITSFTYRPAPWLVAKLSAKVQPSMTASLLLLVAVEMRYMPPASKPARLPRKLVRRISVLVPTE